MSSPAKAPMPAIMSAPSAACTVVEEAAQPLRDTVTLKRLVDVLLFVGPSGCGKSTMIHRLQHDWPHLFEFSVSHTTRSPRQGEVKGQHYHFVTMDEFQHLIDAGAMVEYSRLCSHATSSWTPGSGAVATQHQSKPVGNFYGTSKAALHTVMQRNRVVLMDTDLLGAINIRRYCAREVVHARPVTVPCCKGNAAQSAQQRANAAAASRQAFPATLSPSRLTPTPAPLPVMSSAAYRGSSSTSVGSDAAVPASSARSLRCMIIFIAPPSMEVLEQRLRARKSETEASLQLRMKLNRRWMEWAKENQSFFDFYIVNDDLEECYKRVKRILRSEVLRVESSL